MIALWWRLVRFGFRLLYNELAFTYDLISTLVSLGAWRCWQRAALNHVSAPTGTWILELAHGTGDLQLDLVAAGYRVVGHDLSPYMGRIAQRKLRRQGVSARLTRGKAQQLPFAKGVFSAVVSTFPTDFIFAPETLHEVHRVLQPGGRLVIVPNGILTGGGVVAAFLEWLYRLTGQRGSEQERALTQQMVAFFDGHGFAAEIVQERCPRSVAQVIVAQKKV